MSITELLSQKERTTVKNRLQALKMFDVADAKLYIEGESPCAVSFKHLVELGSGKSISDEILTAYEKLSPCQRARTISLSSLQVVVKQKPGMAAKTFRNLCSKVRMFSFYFLIVTVS